MCSESRSAPVVPVELTRGKTSAQPKSSQVKAAQLLAPPGGTLTAQTLPSPGHKRKIESHNLFSPVSRAIRTVPYVTGSFFGPSSVERGASVEAGLGAAGRGPGCWCRGEALLQAAELEGAFRAVYCHNKRIEPKGCCRYTKHTFSHLTSPRTLLKAYYVLGLGQRTHMGS